MINEKEIEEKRFYRINKLEQEPIYKIQPAIDSSVDVESIEKCTVKVITGYCGVGKSRNLLIDWENRKDEKKIYLSHSHSFLAEQTRRLPKTRHIKGLRRKCPYRNYKSGNGKIISKLINRGLSNKIICSQCKKMKLEYSQNYRCPYNRQFIKIPNTVMMPIEYSYTSRIKKIKPKIIAVDDCLIRKKNHKKLSELSRFFEHLKFICEAVYDFTTIKNTFEEIIFNEDFEILISSYYWFWNDWVEYIIERAKVEDYLESFPIPYSRISEEEFFIYRNYAINYGIQEQFATPSLFYLFDLIFENPEIQLILIEAIPNKLFLKDLLDLYFKEKNKIIELEIQNIRPDKTTKSKFYRCFGYRDSWYPTTSSIVNSPETVQRICGWIKQILKTKYNGRKDCEIGIIKPKRVEIDNLINRNECLKTKWLNFGNLRGINEMENCNPMFVVGTYNINKINLLEEFKLWFKILPDDVTTYQEKRYRYNDERLDNFRSMFEEDEQFHAVFRSRALTFDREVYCFGLIPKVIYDLFEVEEIRFGRGNKYFSDVRTILVLDTLESTNGFILETTMRNILVKAFSLKNETARRILKEIVEENIQLKFIRIPKGRNRPKVILYKS